MVPAAAAKSLLSCPTLCDPIDGSPPGSAIPGILQARTLEWVAIFFSNASKWKVKVKLLSRVRLFATPWTAAYQVPPSMGFSRQDYWSGLPLPSPNSWFLCLIYSIYFAKKKKKMFIILVWLPCVGVWDTNPRQVWGDPRAPRAAECRAKGKPKAQNLIWNPQVKCQPWNTSQVWVEQKKSETMQKMWIMICHGFANQ